MSENEFVDLEARLRQALRAPLPAAPSSLLDRAAVMVVAPAPGWRRPLRLLLVPVGALVLLAIVTLNTWITEPAATAPRGGFEIHSVGLIEGQGIVTDVWAVRSTFYGVLWWVSGQGEQAALIRSEDGRTWRMEAAPRPDYFVSTGTVVGDTLHVIGRTGTFDAPIWWHDTINDDGWHEVGQMTGMPGSTNAFELGHGAAGWLARISIRDAGLPASDSGSAIRYSQDGLDWVEPAATPQGPKVYYSGVTTNGRSLLVFRYAETEDGAPTEAIVSTDGHAWTAHPGATSEFDPRAPSVPGPRFAAFGGGQFVAVGSIRVNQASTAAAWTSSDGATWVPRVVGQAGDAVPDDLRIVASTGHGFAAMSSENDVWVSPDGATWQAIDVIRDGSTAGPYAAAASDDTMIVGGSRANGEPAVWVVRVASLAPTCSGILRLHHNP